MKASPSTLEISYAYCHRLARRRARNFYYGFLLLPKPRRDALCALYAFLRYCDDVADGEGSAEAKADRLRQWREALEQALDGRPEGNPILPALHDTVERYGIPREYLRDAITGVEMDLRIRAYPTFDELYRYCYHVASVVGLASLHVFGFQDPAARKLAEECGIAFQLTNILRDIREDAALGRIYLPLEDLERFGYTESQLAAGVYNPEFSRLMRFEIERARSYYEKAVPLLDLVEAESRPALWTLMSVYRGVLRAIERNQGNVFARSAALSDMEKMGLLLQAAHMRLRHKAGLQPEWRRFRA